MNYNLGPNKINQMFGGRNDKQFSFLSKLSINTFQVQTG